MPDLDFEVAIKAQVVLLARLHVITFYKCKPEDGIYKLLRIADAVLNGPYMESDRAVFYFSVEAARKIEAIASPHYHALLSAYEITKSGIK